VQPDIALLGGWGACFLGLFFVLLIRRTESLGGNLGRVVAFEFFYCNNLEGDSLVDFKVSGFPAGLSIEPAGRRRCAVRWCPSRFALGAPKEAVEMDEKWS